MPPVHYRFNMVFRAVADAFRRYCCGGIDQINCELIIFAFSYQKLSNREVSMMTWIAFGEAIRAGSMLTRAGKSVFISIREREFPKYQL